MIVLALDTAGVDCSAAVYDSGADAVLAQVTERIGKGHAERLITVIDAALAAAGMTLDVVERIAVTVGPGSFTGIRVGVAAARGFALALKVEAVGISTLAVLAHRHLQTRSDRQTRSERPVVAAIDARRGEIYAQVFDAGGDPLSEPAAMTLAEAQALVRDFGAAVCGSAAPLVAGAPPPGAEGGEPDAFPIAVVARLGARAEGRAGKPKPLYLRAPDARPQAGFALSRL